VDCSVQGAADEELRGGGMLGGYLVFPEGVCGEGLVDAEGREVRIFPAYCVVTGEEGVLALKVC